MSKVKGAIVVETEICKGCGLCIPVCTENVLSMTNEVNRKGYHYAQMDKLDVCNGCTNCAIVCPDRAISVYRLKISA